MSGEEGCATEPSQLINWCLPSAPSMSTCKDLVYKLFLQPIFNQPGFCLHAEGKRALFVGNKSLGGGKHSPGMG